MKLITLFIGGRIDHVIDFDANVDENFVPESFIVSSKQSKTELFAFYHNVGDASQPTIGISGKGKGRNDIIFQTDEKADKAYIRAIKASVLNKENPKEEKQEKAREISLTVELTKDNKCNLDISDLALYNITFDNNSQGRWPLSIEAGVKPMKIEVRFQFDNRPEQVKYIWVAPKEKIEDIVFDFGSEASQMGRFERDSVQDINCICETFNEMESIIRDLNTLPSKDQSENVILTEDSSSIEPMENSPLQSNEKQTSNTKSETQEPTGSIANTYVQQDGSNTKLFKSVFYARQSFAEKDVKAPLPQNTEEGKAPLLKMLTTYQEAQGLLKNEGYIQVPNVKIVSFRGVEVPRVMQGGKSFPISRFGINHPRYFYRASINHFIYCALKNANREFVCLYVLMPNVYTQFDVFKNLLWLRKDIKEMIEKSEINVKCVDISVISESDASLLGTMAWLRSEGKFDLSQGCYLILDAGKGTLDFSVIEYQPDKGKYLNRFRSGIIGAGNTLSYAFFFGLLHDYLALRIEGANFTEADMQHFVCEKVLKGEKVYLKELIDNVDFYKMVIHQDGWKADKNHNPIDVTIEKVSKCSDLNLQSFVSFCKNMADKDKKCFRPLSPEAQQYVDGTVSAIIKEVCRELMLVKKMALNNDGSGYALKGVIYAGRAFGYEELKTRLAESLQKEKIVEADKEIVYKVSSSAANSKNICLFVRSAIKNGKYNNHMLSVPFVKSTAKVKAERGSVFSPIAHWLKKLSKSNKAKGVLDDVKGWSRNVWTSKETYEPGSISENGLVSGFEREIPDNGGCLLLGGTFYPVDKGKYRIFYANDRILLRSYKNGVKELEEDFLDLTTSVFLFSSLFPNVQLVDFTKVEIPPKKILEKSSNELDQEQALHNEVEEQEIDKEQNGKQTKNSDTVEKALELSNKV